MNEPEIRITITPDGKQTVEVFNVSGPACHALSKAYTEDLEEKKTDGKCEAVRQSLGVGQQQTQQL